jgi:NADPH:quinone reductase-like Zn-dependent oxidoreductase
VMMFSLGAGGVGVFATQLAIQLIKNNKKGEIQ